jgi:murein DD-endopeptidase MepM/ murein hydrolase activator NlpD
VIISIAVGYASVSGGVFRSDNRAFAAPVTGLTLPGVSSSIPPSDQSVLRPLAINRTKRAEQPVSTQLMEEAQALALALATPTEQPVVEQEDALLRAASVAPTPELPPYQVYDVQEGDTVSTIAAKFGVDAEYILANNAEIRDSDFLSLGQSIIIPAGNGILHEVRYGETLSDISARYDVDVDSIAAFAANRITTPDDITETQLVYVPGGRVPAVAPPPDAAIEEALEDPVAAAEELPEEDASEDSGDASGDEFVEAAPASVTGLIWPVNGPISSPYSGGHPLGIDIDGFNLVGAPVVAATSGTVVFAGGNACCSYGLYVVVVSPDGIETLYAHLSSISVVQGQTVSQGEVLGIIGDTGYSTGVHLHFEVIDNGVRQNPVNYLP